MQVRKLKENTGFIINQKEEPTNCNFQQFFGFGFFADPDPDQTFFPESESGSAENPDPIWKNPDPDP